MHLRVTYTSCLLASLVLSCATDAPAPDATPPNPPLAEPAAPPAPSAPEAEGALVPGRRVTPFDVALLLPKPSPTGLLTGAESGRRGVLVPARVLAQVPSLDVTKTTSGPTAAQLQLVGVRLDPCTGATQATSAACQAEVRLVFQIFDGDFVRDGAVHAFYALTNAELDAFVDALVLAREQAGVAMPAALGVHPVLAKQGLAGAYGRVLKQRILAVAGQQNLTRVTFFSRSGTLPTGPWEFGLFAVRDGVPTTQRIATTNGPRQTVEGIRITNPSTVPEAAVAMKDPGFDDADDAEVVAAQLTLEDPRVHSSETVGCVECHRATVTLRNRFLPFPGLETMGYQSAVGTKVMGAVDDTSPVTNFHLFSYFQRQANVAQRVGNEVAATVERLRQRRR